MGDLLERFKESLDKGINMGSVKSKELLETTRLGAQLGRLSEAKREALAELGTIVYAVYLAGEAAFDPRITAQCAKIKAIEEEIARKEEELKEVRLEAKRNLGIPVCGECGQELAEGDRFCRACGRKVEMKSKSHQVLGATKVVILLLLFFSCFGLDFLVKRWAQAHLAGRPPIQIVPGLFELRYAENTGVAFSLLYSLPGRLRQAVIYTFNAVAIAGLLFFLYRWRKKGLTVLIPLVLILSGAWGNLYDRLIYGHVIDLFHLHYREKWSFPIFNPADVLICCGAGLFILFSWGEYQREVCGDDES